MKIAIDSTPLSVTKAGIGYYAYELCINLPQLDLNNEYFILTHNKSTLSDIAFSPNVSIIELESKRPGFAWIFKSAAWARKNNMNFLISPSNMAFSLFFSKTIQAIHDLTPITHRKYFTIKTSLVFSILARLAAWKAYKIITISETSKKEICRVLKANPSKVLNFSIGLNSWHKIKSSAFTELQAKFKIPANYFLSVGTIEPRKNHIGMIKAFAILTKEFADYKYIIVGKLGWMYKEIFETVNKLGLADKVMFLGYLNESELKSVYENAKLILMCSFFEGFGLPSIEAFSAKKPIILSDIEVFREIGNPNASYADPNSPEDIANKAKIMMAHLDEFVFPNSFLLLYNWNAVSKRYKSLFNNSTAN